MVVSCLVITTEQKRSAEASGFCQESCAITPVRKLLSRVIFNLCLHAIFSFYFISSRTAQPFDSVGYRRMQIARIWVDEKHTSSVFGGVSLSERRAYGIFPNGTTINVSFGLGLVHFWGN